METTSFQNLEMQKAIKPPGPVSGPDAWGPHGWKFIHWITLGYPPVPSAKQKEEYLNFFEALKNVIPCSICGSHFKEHMKKLPLTDEILSDKNKLIKWGIDMHNEVNIMNKKKVYSFEEGLAEIKKHCVVNCYDNEDDEDDDKDNKDNNTTTTNIEKFTNKTNFTDSKIYKAIIVIILICIILLIYFMYIK
jgi:hypothetical protein